MRLHVFVLLLGVLAGFPSCAKEDEEPPGLFIGDARFEEYIAEFVANGMEQGLDVLPHLSRPKLEIRLEDLSSWGATTIGVCERGSDARIAHFDSKFWSRASETQRQLLVAHELGHCVLDRGHNKIFLPNSAYASIMYPVMMAESTYTEFRSYYQEELYTSGERGWSGGMDPSPLGAWVCGESF